VYYLKGFVSPYILGARLGLWVSLEQARMA